MRYISVPLEVREVGGSQEGRFRGHASVWGVKDAYGTVFDKGSFIRTLAAQDGELPITFFHMPWYGIGIAYCEEDNTGLLVDGFLNVHKSRDAAEVYGGLPDPTGSNPAAGYYSQMSHGFDPIASRIDEDDGLEHYTEVKSYEVAIVMRNFAANPEADITEVRSRMLALQMALRGGSARDVIRLGQDTVAMLRAGESDAAPFLSLRMAGRDREWNAAEAIRRVKRWAKAHDAPNERYGNAFLWADGQRLDQFSAYQLPFADIINGELCCIPRGLVAAAGRVDEVEIPDVDREAVRALLSRYYARMREEFGDDTIVPAWEDGRSFLVIGNTREARRLLDSVDGLLHRLDPGPVDTTQGGSIFDPHMHSETMAAMSRLSEQLEALPLGRRK